MNKLMAAAAIAAILLFITGGLVQADPPGGFKNAKGLYEAPLIAERGAG